jgi:hypothetical protein
MASPRRSALVAYLAVGVAWFLFLVFAARVRTIEPIFLWVAAHQLALERAFPRALGLSGVAILLCGYLAAAILAWICVERPSRDPSRIWRRAVLSWIGVQAIFCIVAALLGQFGLLYE